MSKITNSTVFRENIRKKFHPLLDLEENDAINLEKGVFNYAIQEATRKKLNYAATKKCYRAKENEN